ncbi:3'-5' exonuclease family protein [Histomonas meleagridis]|uniref:3'-5' exonuclease family protein n=1 Tax=Histomonas meleagridis TaxID=135588 RepID=UPI00355AA72D|nr:3'-5' exonuclease family protein [Histomonas meleagridis]KAH0799107.1 3'-5' exonuclease family protein [Histomonas meleagridis]
MGEVIRFQSESDLLSYEEVPWALSESHEVEFFTGKIFNVTLISVENPDFEDYLIKLDDGSTIALDLEWENELSLFQFCTSKGVLIVRHPKGPGNKILHNFLASHNFYAKGINNDLKKLKEKFGENFSTQIEDIAKTRLSPYGHSQNFMEMTNKFVGNPTVTFKDIRITKSNWDSPVLTKRQVLYAAFDVVALFCCYPNFPPPMKIQKTHQPVPQRPHKTPQRIPFSQIDIPKRVRPVKEKKETITKIILKKTDAKLVYNYVIYVSSSLNCIGISNLSSSLPFKDDIDFISSYSIDDNHYLFLSLLHDHDITPYFSSFEKVPQCDPTDFTESDVMYIFNVPQTVNNADSIMMLLYSFGKDHRIIIYDYYIRIQPHNSQSSLRTYSFLPYIKFGDTHLDVYTIPSFLPTIRATLPHYFTEPDVDNLFSPYGTIVSKEFLRSRTEQEPKTILIKYKTVEEAELTIASVNYTKINDFTVYVCRFVDENHTRFLRNFELTVHEIIDDRSLRQRFEKYGDILQAHFDSRFNVGRVQFYRQKAALAALSSEPNTTICPYGTLAFVRNLPMDITNEQVLELTQQFGTVLNFMFRELDPYMRTAIVEVTYSKQEEATALKKAYHLKKYCGRELEINAISPNDAEAPIWKMQQRKNWISIYSNDLSKEKIYEKCSGYGTVLEVLQFDDRFYVKFFEPNQATLALEKLDFENCGTVSVNQFVYDICPDDFEIVQQEFHPRKYTPQQVMALAIDPVPQSLDINKINEILNGLQNYEAKFTISHEFEGRKRALIYTQSKRMVNIIHGRFHNIKIEGELLPLKSYRVDEIPFGPKKYPFKDLHSPKKMPIVIDPIPGSLTVQKINEICAECGKFEAKITPSAKFEGMKRAIVQPKNARAKNKCFKLLNLTTIDGMTLVAVRMSKDSIPKPIGYVEEEDVEEFID